MAATRKAHKYPRTTTLGRGIGEVEIHQNPFTGLLHVVRIVYVDGVRKFYPAMPEDVKLCDSRSIASILPMDCVWGNLVMITRGYTRGHIRRFEAEAARANGGVL